MKTETLIKQLEEKGFVYPTCLQWQVDDIDLRLRSIGQGDQVKMLSDLDKRMLLEDFFAEYSDLIIEYINQELEEHLENLSHFNLSDQPF